MAFQVGDELPHLTSALGHEIELDPHDPRGMQARFGLPGNVEVLLCGIGEQEKLLHDGRTDAALVHRLFDCVAGFDSEEQVAIVPAATRTSLTMAEVSNVPDLPMARWPRRDDTYPPGPRDQSQLIALGAHHGRHPVSSRAWLWTHHAAVPVTAPLVTTLIALATAQPLPRPRRADPHGHTTVKSRQARYRTGQMDVAR